MEKGFLDIKVGDVVIVHDEYGHDYEEHYFKVESIEYDDALINGELNPKGMRCYGIDLDCWNEAANDYDTDEYIGVVTEGNFVGFKNNVMTKNYVLQILKEAHLWKVGESDTFEVMLSQKWKFTLRKEEEIYAPFTFSLNGRKIGTNETWSRRYRSMEEAFLHVVNHLNENANVKNRYNYIEDWLLGN